MRCLSRCSAVYLREYTIHFKWLTDQANLSVTVNGKAEWVSFTPFPVGPTEFHIPEPDLFGATIKRMIDIKDIIMPYTYVSVRWINVSP